MKKIILINCYFGKFPWYFDSNFFRTYSVKILKGRIKYFYYKKWHPFKIKISYKVDFVFSAVFKKSELKNIIKGKYQLGNWVFCICQNENGTNVLSFNGSEFNYRLVNSIFDSNIYFLKGLPYNKFKMMNSKEDFHKTFMDLKKWEC